LPTKTYESAPSLLPLYAKAVAPAVPGLSLLPGVRRGGRDLPDLELLQQGVRVDRDRLAEYAEVCGFGLRDTVPATYPHILAFPLHMALMTDGTFPFAPMGLVHVANRITQHRPVRAGDVLDLKVHAADLRTHPKGRRFDIVSEASVGGEVVWRDVSTMLRRGGGGGGGGDGGDGGGERRGDPRADRPVPAGVTRWSLPGDLGRRYAAVSGDRNPIHLYGATAKAFGFPRQIAHGMWSKARCLAALESRLPDAFDVDVEFRKPVLLPATVAFGTAHGAGEAVDFALTDAEKGTPHLVGSVRPL
jgi:acyl dehydratase